MTPATVQIWYIYFTRPSIPNNPNPYLLKVARLMINLRNRKSSEHYGEDVWANADDKSHACFDFLCGNHTRNLPVVRFNKVNPFNITLKRNFYTIPNQTIPGIRQVDS